MRTIWFGRTGARYSPDRQVRCPSGLDAVLLFGLAWLKAVEFARAITLTRFLVSFLC